MPFPLTESRRKLSKQISWYDFHENHEEEKGVVGLTVTTAASIRIEMSPIRLYSILTSISKALTAKEMVAAPIDLEGTLNNRKSLLSDVHQCQLSTLTRNEYPFLFDNAQDPHELTIHRLSPALIVS